MTRVKRGVATHKRHKNILALAKGYRRLNGNVYARAKTAIMKAGQHAYIGRKLKKRQFR
jgi:large subunit ribosomal protein L20